MPFKKRGNSFNKITDRINNKINEVNEKVMDVNDKITNKINDMNDKIYEVNDKISNKVYGNMPFKRNDKNDNFCEICNTETQLLSKIGKVKVCKTCARKLKLSTWMNVEFENNEEIEKKKKEILSIANEIEVPDNVKKAISTYFEKQLSDGVIHMLNGDEGQIIKVYEDHCEIITKYISDETKKQYFKMNGMSSFNFDNILSNIDAGDVIMGVVGGGGIAKIGTKIAKNVAVKTAVNATKEKSQKGKRIFPVIEGKRIVKYNEYDIVKVRKSDDDELGYMLLQNSKYANDPDEDILFFFYPTSSRNKKITMIQTMIREKMAKYQNNMTKSESSKISDKLVGANSSVADEILKFKNLLDMGVITEEEFEEKKKQLLNL